MHIKDKYGTFASAKADCKDAKISIVFAIIAIIALFSGLFGLNHLVSAQSVERLKAVQSGEAVLSCHFKGDSKPRVIPADRVTDLNDGRWYFKKGSATNCEFNEVTK